MLDSAGRPIDGVYGATDGPTAEKTGNVTLIGIECRRGFLLRPPLLTQSASGRTRECPSCQLTWPGS
jgi:hypothetical protein